MPVIAIVDGVKIMIFFRDHAPPHIHVEYGEHKAQIAISDGEVMNGSLPPAKMRKVLKFVYLREKELAAAWGKAVTGRKPGAIE